MSSRLRLWRRLHFQVEARDLGSTFRFMFPPTTSASGSDRIIIVAITIMIVIRIITGVIIGV